MQDKCVLPIGYQLWGADEQQPEGRFKASDVVYLLQYDPQAFFCACGSLTTFLDNTCYCFARCGVSEVLVKRYSPIY
ncbi:hypothetical protein [Izhakiella capsodis]|uniref:hypothetical protein n=1 Tax=Izhakiella capsodis TaxID=1367852 RepID=UPI000B87C08F|nr:hypothetical protein [Izhakiella capsodis]